MGLNGITEKYIVVSVLGDDERPVYVYEFSANETNDLNQATSYDAQEESEQSADLLNQMATLQQTGKTFEARKVTTIVEGVE